MATPRLALTPAQRQLRELADTIPALTRLPPVTRFHALTTFARTLDTALRAAQQEAIYQATRANGGGLTYRQAVAAGLAQSTSMVNKAVTAHKLRSGLRAGRDNIPTPTILSPAEGGVS